MYDNHYHHAAPDHVEPFHAEYQQPQEPQVMAAQEETSEQPGREADPYEVIDFLLKKVEEQQNKLTEQDGFIELQNQEIEQIKGQFEVAKVELDTAQLDLNSTKQAFETAVQALDTTKNELENAKLELERQLADYDVLMQNTLAVEHELDQFKAKVTEKPTIKLPFHAEQKLAKLGYGEPQPLALEDREAV
jgi:chromosome segregation ATPase